MSDTSCGCTCTPDPAAVRELVKSALYSEQSAGNLQPPLLNTSGTRLGAATVMTADQTKSYVDAAIANVAADVKTLQGSVSQIQQDLKELKGNALTGVTTDDSLSGLGTPQSKLGIAFDWLKTTIGRILQVDGSVVASRVTTTDSVSTVVIGDTGYTMGGPMGFIPIPGQDNVGIPLFATRRQ